MKLFKNMIEWLNSNMEEGGEVTGILVAFFLVTFGLLMSFGYIAYKIYTPHKMPASTCSCHCSQSQ